MNPEKLVQPDDVGKLAAGQTSSDNAAQTVQRDAQATQAAVDACAASSDPEELAAAKAARPNG